jgi:hypothetical protein
VSRSTSLSLKLSPVQVSRKFSLSPVLLNYGEELRGCHNIYVLRKRENEAKAVYRPPDFSPKSTTSGSDSFTFGFTSVSRLSSGGMETRYPPESLLLS